MIKLLSLIVLTFLICFVNTNTVKVLLLQYKLPYNETTIKFCVIAVDFIVFEMFFVRCSHIGHLLPTPPLYAAYLPFTFDVCAQLVLTL